MGWVNNSGWVKEKPHFERPRWFAACAQREQAVKERREIAATCIQAAAKGLWQPWHLKPTLKFPVWSKKILTFEEEILLDKEEFQQICQQIGHEVSIFLRDDKELQIERWASILEQYKNNFLANEETITDHEVHS